MAKPSALLFLFNRPQDHILPTCCHRFFHRSSRITGYTGETVKMTNVMVDYR